MAEELTGAQMVANRTLRGLRADLGLPCAVLIVEAGEDGEAFPFASLHGNVTSFANMARSLIHVALNGGRPTDCLACMENYDMLVRAQAALEEVVGRC